jgi:predicted kinase
MYLVIVSGPEATGKTTVGKTVAHLLGYQYHSKDMVKEKLFDTEVQNTWHYAWYENKAKDQFFTTIEQLIAQGTSAVIESNFIGADRQRLADCLNSDTIVTELYCTTKGMTSFKRFVRRNESGVRHKGHHDRRWYIRILCQNLLRYVHITGSHKPLGFTKQLLVVDSTDFFAIDYQKIVEFITTATP